MKKHSVETIRVNGIDVVKVTLANHISKVVLLSYGAGVYQYQYHHSELILIPKTINDYMDDMVYYGKTIGRTSGRLVVPSYEINQKSYEVKPYRSAYTSLHGGKIGFSTRNFELTEHDDQKATFRYISKDLEEGYPGRLTLDVSYELKIDGSLNITHHATSTKDTLCNITNHVYFNLNQTKPHIYDTQLQLKASSYLDINQDYILRKVKSVNQSVFDFRTLTKFRDKIEAMQKTSFEGFDHTWIFDDVALDEPKAIAYDSSSNLGIKTYTSYPAVVLYTHNDPAGIDLVGPFDEEAIHSSFTLECQFEPGGIHHENLNKAILKKDEVYHHFIKYAPFIK